MRTAAIVLVCVLATAVATWVIARDSQSTDERPVSVLIVPASIHNTDGVGTTEAISILNQQKIADLEALFPNYRSRPSSSMAAGWMTGWEIYFNFPKGRTIRVIVSQNDDGQTWSTGDGDFATAGKFKAYLEQLPTLDREAE